MLNLLFEPPIQQLSLPVFREHGVNVYMKREDLIHPFISGNKWRKLKYVLQDAQSQNKHTLVSFGGAYSNHLVALACAGALYGFKTVAFIRGEEVQNYMLGLCKTWGMELHFTSRERYKNKTLLYDSFATETCYFIDEGGKGVLAAKGCEEMLENVNGFTHIFCAVGTGTTFAGLANAATPKGIKTEGICVLKGAAEIDQEITLLLTKKTAVSNKLKPNDLWKVHHQFHGGGYAKTTPELVAFIDDFASQTGILLDPIYTAKMMQGVIALTKENYFNKGDSILTIHTGGLLGLLSSYT